MDGSHLTPDATIATDRRAAGRNSVAWEAEIVFRGRTAACLVLDINPTGAKLQVSVPISRDTPIRLEIPGKGIYLGNVRWRDGELVGVRFLNGLGSDPDSTEGQ